LKSGSRFSEIERCAFNDSGLIDIILLYRNIA
jgi:hypothetical protein